MTTISSTSILASHNVADHDYNRNLHTLVCRYPLWIHQELLTHRAFSKNSASSRAIPVKRMIEEAKHDPAMPIYWTKDQPGMQGYEFLEGYELSHAKSEWIEARDFAVKKAEALLKLGAHKQVANRLLGPFIHITVTLSATEWTNFDGIRQHHMAEPHMRDLAKSLYAARQSAKVRQLNPGEWHIPFVNADDYKAIGEANDHDSDFFAEACGDDLRKLSVARCASTSYKTVEGFDMTLDRARKLYDKLVTSEPLHASPTEHVAQADDFDDAISGWQNPKQHRNFVGFRQFRAMLPNDTL